jgi:AcrR family transcriptional regulator
MARVRTAFPGRAHALAPEGSLSPRDGPTSADSSSNGGSAAGGGEARERILDAAEDLFAADGFDATPTSRIAHRAGVAKGLLFYYFPRKMDLLRTLFAERLRVRPLSSVAGIAVRGDLAGSLVRLADRIGLTRHHSQVLSAILFREASTHPDVREHLGALHTALMDVTEEVLDAASPRALERGRRRAAASTFVAVMMHEANFHRFDGPVPDVCATAEIVSSGLLA